MHLCLYIKQTYGVNTRSQAFSAYGCFFHFIVLYRRKNFLQCIENQRYNDLFLNITILVGTLKWELVSALSKKQIFDYCSKNMQMNVISVKPNVKEILKKKTNNFCMQPLIK